MLLKTIQEMKRHEIVFALGAYVHPSMYHGILNWPTEGLRLLLEHHTLPERYAGYIKNIKEKYKEMEALRELKEGQIVIIGVDVAHHE